MARILAYDSTLRDGAQTEGISFSLEDKLGIAARLDELGIDYIEGGFAESNPKDRAFFDEVRKLDFKHSRIAVFGATRRVGVKVEEDTGVGAMLRTEAPVLTIVGKTWDLHVDTVLRTTLDENLAMIEDTVRYLKSRGREVIYDAEHFYDGCAGDADYAMKTLIAAAEAGADAVVLCDTNGGALPGDVERLTREAVQKVSCVVGFHGHNDGGVAVANTLVAVQAGATHVQGTMNGLGERSGNADLCVVIPNLQLKMGHEVLPEGKLTSLTQASRYCHEIANMGLPNHQPFVGPSAFTHKGGQHVDAMLKNPLTYEHINPELVGNERRMLVSELAGGAAVAAKLKNLDADKDMRRKIINRVKEKESEGYHYEAAEASFELMVQRVLGDYTPFFELHGFRVIVQKREDGEPVTEATLKIRVDGEDELTACEGNGPINALDGALRKALYRFYPTLKDLRLIDYKVRVINSRDATAAKVRVFIESRDHEDIWGTVGVSENIIQASWEALVDSVEYKLSKDRLAGR